MTRAPYSLGLAATASLLLGACSAFAPPVAMPDKTPPPLDAPPAWLAPPPQAAAQTALRDWWTQFNDPVLLEMIDAAQAASPTVAAAASRIEQARASSVAAGAL
ncbi:MAG: outer rane efflux protein, partial [Proteobacteria bacterium]|nr:outer rane efflux protein [Pseudomonadota bacterium]